jgi:predicted nucleotidyltransferase
MGNSRTAPSGLAGALFSTVQQRVLALLFGEPERDFSTSEVIRAVGSGTGAVHRELARLASSGLVTVAEIGNQKRYRANRGSPVFKELRSLILKTIGLVGPLREGLKSHVKRIRSAFVYGSIAKGGDTSKSDIDLMVLADDLAYAELFAALEETERKLGRKINPNVMTPADWRRKLKDKNSFVRRVAQQPKLFVLGSEDDLGSAD